MLESAEVRSVARLPSPPNDRCCVEPPPRPDDRAPQNIAEREIEREKGLTSENEKGREIELHRNPSQQCRKGNENQTHLPVYKCYQSFVVRVERKAPQQGKPSNQETELLVKYVAKGIPVC